MSRIRRCRADERLASLAIVNAAAEPYQPWRYSLR